jgi:hypothetical protein
MFLDSYRSNYLTDFYLSEHKKENTMIDRRDFLKLLGMGSAVLVLGPRSFADAATTKAGKDDFFFVQLSDSHWGFGDPKINPDAKGTLKKAIAAVNSMKTQPDFIIFTGDIT